MENNTLFNILSCITVRTTQLAAVVLICMTSSSCTSSSKEQKPPVSKQNDKIVFEHKSLTPSFVKTMPDFDNVQVFTLISSEDVLTGSPNFIFGAQPDGAGLLKDPGGKGYIMISNHEALQSVSRVFIDETFKPVKGEYILDAEGGMWRLCSGTMVTPEEHGFGPLFLTAGEVGPDSRVHAIDPFAAASDKKRTDRIVAAFGRASMENAVPLPKDAFPGKTVVLMGEDNHNGQVMVYISNVVGDLNNGKLYFLRRKDQDPVETNMTPGTAYDAELVEADNFKDASGTEMEAQAVAKKAIQFGRVEDLDYRKGGGAHSREIYFSVTGVANTTGKTMWGRVYQLVLDGADPLKGKLTPVADGAKNPGNDLINPDNICATENYVYIQEDGDSYYPGANHDSYIWQYTIATHQYKPFITAWHRRDDKIFNSAAENGYNQSGRNDKFGSWEFGAMYDISNAIGVDNVFLLNIHPHTWQKEKFLHADGTTITNNREGGQVVLLKNVPR